MSPKAGFFFPTVGGGEEGGQGERGGFPRVLSQTTQDTSQKSGRKVSRMNAS